MKETRKGRREEGMTGRKITDGFPLLFTTLQGNHDCSLVSFFRSLHSLLNFIIPFALTLKDMKDGMLQYNNNTVSYNIYLLPHSFCGSGEQAVGLGLCQAEVQVSAMDAISSEALFVKKNLFLHSQGVGNNEFLLVCQTQGLLFPSSVSQRPLIVPFPHGLS